MTLSNGQALAGAHIPALGPLRETVKLPPNASTLRAIRRASITGTFVTAKSGDKAAPWFRLASGGAPSRRLRTPPMVIVLITPICSCHHAPRGGSTNSVVRVMLIMYVKCVSVLGHKSMALTCGYSFTDLDGRATPQVTDMGVQLPLGQRPFAHATVPPVPGESPTTRIYGCQVLV